MIDDRRSAGFTLIELTVSVAILGIVMAAVATTFVVALRTTQEATARTDEGGDLQLLSTLLGPDVQGANTITANNQPGFTAPTATPACGPADDTLVVQFQGPDVVDLDTTRTTTVSYVLAGGGIQLVRRQCTGSSSSPDSQLDVASALAPDQTPVVACRTAAGDAVACGQSGAAALTLTVTAGGGNPHSLTASRRTS